MSKKLFLLFGSISLLTVMYVGYGLTKRSGSLPGWVPDNFTPPPFDRGIITDGRTPEEFEISVIEPNSLSPINAGLSNSCVFSIMVSSKNQSISPMKIPPTFVSIKIFQNKKQVQRTSLKPSSKCDKGYIFSGKVIAPSKPGIYEVIGEAEYSIYHVKNDKPVQLESMRRTTQGIPLYVH
jgi:hypothetical protein